MTQQEEWKAGRSSAVVDKAEEDIFIETEFHQSITTKLDSPERKIQGGHCATTPDSPQNIHVKQNWRDIVNDISIIH